MGPSRSKKLRSVSLVNNKALSSHNIVGFYKTKLQHNKYEPKLLTQTLRENFYLNEVEASEQNFERGIFIHYQKTVLKRVFIFSNSRFELR